MEKETPTGEATPAPAAGDAKPTAPETPKDPAFTPEQVKVVTTIRDELKESKAALKTAQDQLTLYQAQLATGSGGSAPAAPAAPEDPFKDMQDADVMTVSDVKKIMAAQGSQGNPTVKGLQNTVAKLEVMVQDPDYQTTIKTYLPDVIKMNPAIANAIQAAPNQLLTALNYAKMSPAYIAAQNQNTPPPQDDVMAQLNRIIENSEKPGSPSSAGGGGALSSADRFSSMSDEEFDAHMQKVLAG